MLSDSPGTPGRKQQMPRITAITFTPARDASYKASISSTSVRLFIFSQIVAGLLSPANEISF
jgi:hypothetical protein